MISLMNPSLGLAVSSLATGTEGPLYANWLVDRSYTSRRPLELTEAAQR